MIEILVGLATALTIGSAAFGTDAPQPLRIALISDTHTTHAATGDQAQYPARFDRVIASVNAAVVDVALISGDLTQGGRPEEMADFQKQIKGLHVPVWVVPGNHDIGGKQVPGHEGVVTETRLALYEKTFGPSFWSKTLGGVRILGLNSSVLGSGLPREADQWAFLEKALAGPQKTPTLVVMHYPLFLHTSDEPGGDYWNIEPQPRARLLALLHRGGVRAVLTGHLHRPLFAQEGGILLYTTPPVSFGLPTGRQAEGWTLITVSPGGTIVADFHPTDPPI